MSAVTRKKLFGIKGINPIVKKTGIDIVYLGSKIFIGRAQL